MRRAYVEFDSEENKIPTKVLPVRTQKPKYTGFSTMDDAYTDLELWAQWYATHGRDDEEFVIERGLTPEEAQIQLALVHKWEAENQTKEEQKFDMKQI